jgi:hypothetical protein
MAFLWPSTAADVLVPMAGWLPAMGMFSISLGEGAQLWLSSLGTHVHCRAPKDGGASFSMALALLVSGAVMCCVSISITESKTDEAKDNMGGRRTGGSKG